MLNHPTLAQLEELGFSGMAKALRELLASGDAAGLSLTEGSACFLTARQATGATNGWHRG